LAVAGEIAVATAGKVAGEGVWVCADRAGMARGDGGG